MQRVTKKDQHGPSIKNPRVYEALRRKGMSKQKAAAISNAMVQDGEVVTTDGVQFTEELIFDAAQIRMTSDGYMVAAPRLARVGIQLYKGFEVGRPDMDVVRVMRPESEVFADAAMSSLAFKPITINHPDEAVNSKNWKKYAVGHLSGDIARDGDFVRVPLVLMDQDAIDAYQNGRSQLSVGYGATLVWGEGENGDGECFDCMQTDIRANHVAMVDKARGGEKLKIGDVTDPDDPDEDDDELQPGQNVTMSGQEGCPPGTQGKVQSAESTAGFHKVSYKHPKTGKVMQANIHKSKLSPVDSAYDDSEYFDREFSAMERQKLAKTGAAMPHGGYPIKSGQDLRNAIRAIGRAKNPGATKAHIKKRARALGLTKLIPSGWGDSEGNHSHERTKSMTERVVNLDGVNIELEGKDGQILERHLAGLAQKIDDAEGNVALLEKKISDMESAATEAKKASDTKDGEIAALKKQLADAEITPQKLDQYVRERMDIVERAIKVIGDKAKPEGKTDIQIKREVVSDLMGAEACKSMSDDAITGAFYALTRPSDKQDGLRRVADSFSRAGDVLVDNEPVAKAYAKRNQALADAWKPKPAH